MTKHTCRNCAKNIDCTLINNELFDEENDCNSFAEKLKGKPALISMGYRPLNGELFAKPIGNQMIVYDWAHKIFYLYFRACNGKTMVYTNARVGNGRGFDYQIDEDITVDLISSVEVNFLYNIPKGNQNYNFAFINQQEIVASILG